MAIEYVREVESTTATATPNENSYTRQFLVKHDANPGYDGARLSRDAAGVPAIGDVYPSGGALEEVINITATNVDGEPSIYLVTVTYGFPDATTDISIAPWLRPNVYQVSNLPTSKIASINYIDGNLSPKAIANAVGDPIRTQEIQFPQIQIVVNAANLTIDLATIKSKIGTINDDVFSFSNFPGGSGTFAVKTVLFSNYSASEQQYQGTNYWQEQYTFLVRDEEFIEQLRNRGPNHYSTASTPATYTANMLNGKIAFDGDLNANGTLITTTNGGKLVPDNSNPNYIDVQYFKVATLGTLV